MPRVKPAIEKFAKVAASSLTASFVPFVFMPYLCFYNTHFHGVRPYASTVFARAWAERRGVRFLAVQRPVEGRHRACFQ